MLTGHLVEDDERQHVYPSPGIRTDGGSADKQIALLVEDECQFGIGLMVSVEKEELAIRHIYDTIFAVFSRLVKTDTHLSDTWESEHEIGHGGIADRLVGLAKKQVSDILALEKGRRRELGYALVDGIARGKDIFHRGAQMVVDFDTAGTGLYAQGLKPKASLVMNETDYICSKMSWIASNSALMLLMALTAA